MKKLTPKNKTLLGYILYGILLTICLLYIMFPADVFREYLIASVNRANPRFRLSVEDARLSLPIGVKFQQATLFLKQEPGTLVFRAERLMIRPEIWSFLTGKSSFDIDCEAYGGNLKGRLRFSKKGIIPPFSTSIELKDISIDDYSYLSVLTGRKSSGILGGDVTYKGLTDGTGEANLKITDGSIGLQEPFFNLDSVEFDELLVKLVLKEKKIELSHVKLKGKGIQGTLSGTIRLQRNFMKSSLDLKGTVEMLGSLFKGGTKSVDTKRFQNEPLTFSFVIHGTLGDPKFRVT